MIFRKKSLNANASKRLELAETKTEKTIKNFVFNDYKSKTFLKSHYVFNSYGHVKWEIQMGDLA